MIANRDARIKDNSSERQEGTDLSWKKLTNSRPSPAVKRRRRILGTLSILLLIVLFFVIIRFLTVASAVNDQLYVHIGDQQVATIDTRQNSAISPNLFGANIFPQRGTTSVDKANGTIYYSDPLPQNLMHAHVHLLRFPGGNWGEDHYLSFDQLSNFATLLSQTNADGMIQARLSGPIGTNYTALKDVQARAELAATWVDFLNNPNSARRVGKYAHAPFYPVKFWTVGNEPDKLINPATGQLYTVNAYVQDFITFSTYMHTADPTIQAFGPELSSFNGPGAGPRDATGQLWMEGFLKGVGAYEQAHPNPKFHLLDGISFHYYEPSITTQNPSQLLSSTAAWNYLLPLLHQTIGGYMKRDLPVAITEINTNNKGQIAPPSGLAALWWADTLGTLMNLQVEYAAFAPASGSTNPYPLLQTQNLQPTSMFRAMELFAHLQTNLIPLQTQQEPVSVYATQNDTHQILSLLFINKSSMPQLVQLGGNSSMAGISPWPNRNVSLSAYSIVELTIQRNGGADAYSYVVPGSGDTAGTVPLLHTQCGHKTDALAVAIPC